MRLLDVSAIHARYVAAQVARELAPDDDMYLKGPNWYFEVGEDALRCILLGLSTSRLHAVRSILDLPCGHGRVTRHLRAAFPEASITCGDVDSSGVDFCARCFQGEPLLCDPDLLRVEFGRTFDVIWVGSLFTHLDLERTSRWLGRLAEQLSPDGILVATFHGRWSIEVHQRHGELIDAERWQVIVEGYERSGYGYTRYSHSPEKDSFGVSLARASKIVEIAEGIERVRLLGYTERGWGDNQDVLVLAKTDRLQPW